MNKKELIDEISGKVRITKKEDRRMNSQILYFKIKLLRNWLKNQKYESNMELPQSLSWMNLKMATGIYISSEPGFYIVKLTKDSTIVYVGETDCLNRRIGFLKGAIKRGTAPHSGGKTLRKKFGADLSQFEICWLKTTNKYVAELFERYLVLSFYEREKCIPIGNKK